MYSKKLKQFIALVAVFLSAVAMTVAQKNDRESGNQWTKSEKEVSSEATLFGGTSSDVALTSKQSGAGVPVTMPVTVDAVGGENKVRFSISYDTTVVSNPQVSFGADASSATITTNTSLPGIIGIEVTLLNGGTLTAGMKEIVKVTWDVNANAAAGSYSMVFGDSPLTRGVFDSVGGTMASTFTDGTLTVLEPTAGPAVVSGYVMTPFGGGIARAVVTITDFEGNSRMTITNGFGAYSFDDIPSGQSYMVTVSHKSYQFMPDSVVINVMETLSDVNFVGSAN